MRQAATSDAAAGVTWTTTMATSSEERSLLERSDLSSSQPARTAVSGPNDPTRTLESLTRRTFPAISARVKAMSSSGFGQARLAPSRERPSPAFSRRVCV
jgi:hypothetical protein